MSEQSDTKMEIAVGHLLRIGVSIAAAVVLTGWIFYLSQARGIVTDYRRFHGTPIRILHLGPMLSGAASLNGRDIIKTGILLLIATPIARVLFCVVGFARERDKLYILVSTVVLAVLTYSLFFRG